MDLDNNNALLDNTNNDIYKDIYEDIYEDNMNNNNEEHKLIKTFCKEIKEIIINSEGKIINISDMTPLSRASVCSEKPALYALEVNQGVFKKNNINAGDILAINKTLQNDK